MHLTLPSETTGEDVKLHQMEHCAKGGQAGVCHLGGEHVCGRIEDENISKVRPLCSIRCQEPGEWRHNFWQPTAKNHFNL